MNMYISLRLIFFEVSFIDMEYAVDIVQWLSNDSNYLRNNKMCVFTCIVQPFLAIGQRSKDLLN